MNEIISVAIAQLAINFLMSSGAVLMIALCAPWVTERLLEWPFKIIASIVWGVKHVKATANMEVQYENGRKYYQMVHEVNPEDTDEKAS
jgi:hypothetical protein